MRSKCVKNGFGGSKMTSEVARRGQRASLEPSKATKEALGGSRMAFWRPQGHWSMRDVRGDGEMRGVPLSSIWTEFWPGFHTLSPLQAGGGGLSASRILAAHIVEYCLLCVIWCVDVCCWFTMSRINYEQR